MKVTYNLKFIFLFGALCLASKVNGQDIGPFSEVFEFLQLGVSTLKYVKEVWMDVFPDSVDIPLPNLKFPGGDGKAILQKFDGLVSRLDRLQSDVFDLSRSLNQIPDLTKNHLKWEVRMNSLENLVRPIDVLFQRFEQYSRYKDYIESATLKEFSESIISHSTRSVLNLLDEVHHFVVDTKNARDGIFRHLGNVLQANPTFHCMSSLTAQQSLYSLFEMLSLVDAQGYTMVQYAYMYMKRETDGTFDKEIELANTNHMIRTREKIVALKSVIDQVSSLYYRCDPHVHIINKTFHQFTRVMQGYIENEADLSPTSSCTESCPYYSFSENPGCYNNPKTRLCELQEQCRGKILNCRYEYSDSVVCRSLSNSRRYDYIKFDNGVTWGKEVKRCHQTLKVDSWWRWFVHCSYCFCYCDDPNDSFSHRHISLRASLSDVESNKLVTGVKFSKTGDMLHIIVQQGTALPSGAVNATSLAWEEDALFNSTDKGVLEDTDYLKLKWNERAIDLDVLEAPPGHVITGVQFKKLGTHVGLQLRVTRINFLDGKLAPSQSFWINSISTPISATNPRQEYDLSNLDVPTRAPQPSSILAWNNSFITISPSSEVGDAAQTPVPFIDLQPVELRTPIWLSKMGLYYKGSNKFGGFLGVQIGNIEMGKYVEVPPVTPKEERFGREKEKYKFDDTEFDVINLEENAV